MIDDPPIGLDQTHNFTGDPYIDLGFDQPEASVVVAVPTVKKAVKKKPVKKVAARRGARPAPPVAVEPAPNVEPVEPEPETEESAAVVDSEPDAD